MCLNSVKDVEELKESEGNFRTVKTLQLQSLTKGLFN